MNTGKKIMVVDDNAIIVCGLSSFLKSNGYEVLAAPDGGEAIRLARREMPDLVLLDILFPPNLESGSPVWDAFLIMEWFHDMGGGRDIPIIIISGLEPKDYKDRCLAAGARAYFQKPLDMKELLKTIRAIFDNAGKKRPTEPGVEERVEANAPDDLCAVLI